MEIALPDLRAGQLIGIEFANDWCKGYLKLGEVLARKLGAFAILRHVGAQVVNPDFLGVALILLSSSEEQHISLHALRIEDACGQAQDGVQIAFVHQVAADVGADVALEQDVVGQHHRGATPA